MNYKYNEVCNLNLRKERKERDALVSYCGFRQVCSSSKIRCSLMYDCFFCVVVFLICVFLLSTTKLCNVDKQTRCFFLANNLYFQGCSCNFKDADPCPAKHRSGLDIFNPSNTAIDGKSSWLIKIIRLMEGAICKIKNIYL